MSRIRAADLIAAAPSRRAYSLVLPPALGKIPKWVWWAGGAGIVGLILYSFRGGLMSIAGRVVKAGQEQLFAAALPAGVRNYAAQLRAAGDKYGVSPWALAGIMQRESNGGLSLKPQGPSGTGDTYKRGPGSKYYQYADPNTGLPPDGGGWGRGLMQLDYGVHNAWVRSNNWADPQVNIDKAASVLAENFAYFKRAPTTPTVNVESWRLTGLKSADGKVIVEGWGPKYGLKSLGPYRDPRPLSGDRLIEAALAGYNAGNGGVLQAIAAGLPASAPTAHSDYASWILSRAVSWADKFDSLIA